MRLATPLAIIALLAALAGCGGSSDNSSSGESSGTPPASTSTAPTGASARGCPLDAGGIESLRATGVSCGEARRLAIGWGTEQGCKPAPGASRSACSVSSYRCIASATARGLSVSCSRPGRSVAFTARG